MTAQNAVPGLLDSIAVAGVYDVPDRTGPQWATRWAMARQLGIIEDRRDGGFRISLKHRGERYRVGSLRITGTAAWIPIQTREMAEQVLYAIRSRFASGMTLAAAVAPFQKRPAESSYVQAMTDPWLAYQRDLCEVGDLSPSTLRDREGMAKREFAYWDGWDANSIQYAELEQWRLDIGKRGVSPKTAQNILGVFRVMLRWAHRKGFVLTMPEFPAIEVDQKASRVLTREQQAAVIDAIPRKAQGVFRAMAHTLRPGEARALDLWHWREPYMIVERACKQTTADAPIRGLKEHNWKMIGADDGLVEWIRWRIERMTLEQRERQVDAFLFLNPTGRTERKLWSDCAIRDVWVKACRKAGVPYLSPYPSTRHSTATDLLRTGKATVREVQSLLGHASLRSTERYTKLAGGNVADMIRGDRQ